MNATFFILILFVEVMIHGAVFVWMIDRLCRLFAWAFPSKAQPIKFLYPCGCQGVIRPLDQPEFEVLCGEGNLRAGFVCETRFVYDTRCDAHAILATITEEAPKAQ